MQAAYETGLRELKPAVFKLLPPLDHVYSDDGVDYYLRWVWKLSQAMQPVADVLSLTEQLQAMQWVRNLLDRFDSPTYVTEKGVSPDVLRGQLARAMRATAHPIAACVDAP